MQFPRQAVKYHLDRTIGPHGESTSVKLWGVEEPVELSNKEPSQCVHLDGDDEDDDDGKGKRKRYANTSRPVGVPTDVRKIMFSCR
eukprot:16373048-Heterocapsa_arctica.AAC.1